MPTRSTDIYLNIDRWETLSSLERQRGRWEARLDGPTVRLDPVKQDSLLEASWGLVAHGSPLDRAVQDQLLAVSLPDDAELPIRRAWRYYRAAQFVHGWYPAFRWTKEQIAQICKVLAEPVNDKIERAASVLLFLRNQAGQTSQEIGGLKILDVAAFYGGLRHACQEDAAYSHLYLLGFRLMLLQAGYVQVLFSPLEPAWMTALEKSPRPTSPPWDEKSDDLEERLGGWLDEVVQLLVTAGERAEELWEQAMIITPRSSLQETILQLAHRNGRVTAGEILRETGANRNTVKDNLARLVREGNLRREGSKRGTVYLPV